MQAEGWHAPARCTRPHPPVPAAAVALHTLPTSATLWVSAFRTAQRARVWWHPAALCPMLKVSLLTPVVRLVVARAARTWVGKGLIGWVYVWGLAFWKGRLGVWSVLERVRVPVRAAE